MGGQNKRETYSDWLAGWRARNTKMLQMVLVPIANDALTPIYKAIFFLNFVFKNGPLWVNCFLHFPSLNTVFNAVDSKYYCQWLDSNHGSLVLEATTQPTVPQPICSFYQGTMVWSKFVFKKFLEQPTNEIWPFLISCYQMFYQHKLYNARTCG